MPIFKDHHRLFFILTGAAVICPALISDAYWKEIMVGADGKDLSWGPLLFRALLIFHGILLIAVGILWKTLHESATERPNANAVGDGFKISSMAWRVLFILTIVAAVLRLWNLNADLWVDEVFTLLDFARQPFGEMMTSFPSQNQHLLYSILAHSSISLFGESAWALRLPAVIFGLLSIWSLFFLCRKLIGEREALWAAALMTVSYHHIWFSQNARGYTGLLFFTLLATWFWFEALSRNEWRWWFCYAAAVVGGMWIHITMAFVVLAHALVYLIFLVFPQFSGEINGLSAERRAGIKPFAAWILSVSVTTQLYAFALPEFLHSGLHEESNNSEWTNPLWVLTEIFTNLSIGFAGLAVVSAGTLFIAFGWWRFFRRNRRAALVMILPPVISGSLMLALGHNLFPRFFFFAMGFGLMIVIYGVAEFSELVSRVFVKNQENKVGLCLRPLFVSLILIASIVTVPRNYALPKQDYSGAKTYVENHFLPGDRIVAISIAGEMYGRYFAPQWRVAKTVADLEKSEKNAGRVWLIYTLSPEIKAFRPDLWRIIEQNYQTEQVFYGTLNGGEIVVCRKRNFREDENERNGNSRQTATNNLSQ